MERKRKMPSTEANSNLKIRPKNIIITGTKPNQNRKVQNQNVMDRTRPESPGAKLKLKRLGRSRKLKSSDRMKSSNF